MFPGRLFGHTYNYQEQLIYLLRDGACVEQQLHL